METNDNNDNNNNNDEDDNNNNNKASTDVSGQDYLCNRNKPSHFLQSLKAFTRSWTPSSGLVRMDSGWNCTPAIGSVLC